MAFYLLGSVPAAKALLASRFFHLALPNGFSAGSEFPAKDPRPELPCPRAFQARSSPTGLLRPGPPPLSRLSLAGLATALAQTRPAISAPDANRIPAPPANIWPIGSGDNSDSSLVAHSHKLLLFVEGLNRCGPKISRNVVTWILRETLRSPIHDRRGEILIVGITPLSISIRYLENFSHYQRGIQKHSALSQQLHQRAHFLRLQIESLPQHRLSPSNG